MRERRGRGCHRNQPQQNSCWNGIRQIADRDHHRHLTVRFVVVPRKVSLPELLRHCIHHSFTHFIEGNCANLRVVVIFRAVGKRYACVYQRGEVLLQTLRELCRMVFFNIAFSLKSLISLAVPVLSFLLFPNHESHRWIWALGSSCSSCSTTSIFCLRCVWFAGNTVDGKTDIIRPRLSRPTIYKKKISTRRPTSRLRKYTLTYQMKKEASKNSTAVHVRLVHSAYGWYT